MSQIGERLEKVYIKVTSTIKGHKDDEPLIGKVWLADFVLHLGDGIYSVQIYDEAKEEYYLCTSCRIRFIKKENNPEYFL